MINLFVSSGVPVHIRSDYGAEFSAKRVRIWLSKLQIKPLLIEPGSPWENGSSESFSGRMRDELLTGEIVYSLQEAQILSETWKKEYNIVSSHSALGFRPPGPEAIIIRTTQLQSIGLR